MRSLETIQADIRFLMKEKNSFFSRLFQSRTARIETLRAEEFKALDIQLCKEHEAYKSMAGYNQDLLNNIYWELTVTEKRMPLRNNAIALYRISGRINGNGYADCTATMDLLAFAHDPCRLNGQLNHHGYLDACAEKGVSSKPIHFSCYNYDKGQLSIVGLYKDAPVFNSGFPKKLYGDPFQGDHTKRKNFLKTRKEMLHILHPYRQM